MSGHSRSETTQTKGSCAVRARLEVNVCGEEPGRVWNDLWVRILTEFTTTQTAEADATLENEADTATTTAVPDVDRGKMGQG